MIDKIMFHLRPGVEWYINGDSVEGIVMLDGSEPPTQEEVDEALPIVQAIEWNKIMRTQRNRLLAESDWAMMPDAPTNKTAWAEYRQALRDLPKGWEPAEKIDIPKAPA